MFPIEKLNPPFVDGIGAVDGVAVLPNKLPEFKLFADVSPKPNVLFA